MMLGCRRRQVGFVKSVAYVQKRLLMLLDFAKVIGEESGHVSER